MKVAKIEDVPDKLHVEMSETYEVKFVIKAGIYYTTKTQIYCTRKKGQQHLVEQQFRKDFPTARVISVVYQ